MLKAVAALHIKRHLRLLKWQHIIEWWGLAGQKTG